MASYKVWVCVEDEDHDTDIHLDFPSTFQTPNLDEAIRFAKYLHAVPWSLKAKARQFVDDEARLALLHDQGELSYGEYDEHRADLWESIVEYVHELAGYFREE